jgi:ankyrin repeat protein
MLKQEPPPTKKRKVQPPQEEMDIRNYNEEAEKLKAAAAKFPLPPDDGTIIDDVNDNNNEGSSDNHAKGNGSPKPKRTNEEEMLSIKAFYKKHFPQIRKPFMAAVVTGDIEAVQFYVNHHHLDKDLNGISLSEMINDRNIGGGVYLKNMMSGSTRSEFTPLTLAIRNCVRWDCIMPIVKFLCENGADVNISCSDGITPLMHAIVGHDDDWEFSVMGYLLNNGASLSPVVSSTGESESWGDEENPNNRIGQNALHIAAYFSSVKVLKQLLNHPSMTLDIINATDFHGNTPLDCSKEYNRNYPDRCYENMECIRGNDGLYGWEVRNENIKNVYDPKSAKEIAKILAQMNASKK